MPFTNDDLAELKDLIKATVYWSPKIPDLIARMEAAEQLSFARHQRLSCLTTTCDSDCKRSSKRNLEIAETAWRESCGRGEEK